MAKYSNQVIYDIKTTLDASGITKLQSELAKVQSTLNSLTSKRSNKLGLNVDELEAYRFEVEKLSKVLTTSFDTRTGMVNLEKFNAALHNGTLNAERLGAAFNATGSQGKLAFNSLVTSVTKLNKNAVTANSTLTKIANTFSNTVRWGITASIFQEMMGSIQGAVSYMKDLDESLTNIQMVTGSSKEDMRELAQYANNAAQALGSTTTDYTNAVKVFVQEGFSESESKQYANLSTKLANVSEQNTATTSDQITAYRNAFQLDYEQTAEAMDKVANVANNTASNVNELMTASQRAASVAQAVGSSQDSFLAAIATIESVTRQSAEEIGNGLKTIYQRFADIKVGGSTEDGVDYGQYAKALQSVGVDVLDAAGQFKGMDQILSELQDVWSTLDDTMKIAVGEKVAGKFQYNRFAALMNNQEYYQKALGATQGAGGMMDQMNDVYMEGIEGRLKTMQAAGEQIMSTLFNQDSIEPVLGAATDFLNVINKIFDSIGGGIPLLTALSSVLLRTFNAQIGEQIARIATNITTISQENKNSKLIDTTVNLIGDMAPKGKDESSTYNFASRTAGTVKGLSDTSRQKWSENIQKSAEVEQKMADTEREYNNTIEAANAKLQKRAGKNKEIIKFSAEDLQLGEEKFELEEEKITLLLKENRVMRENKGISEEEAAKKAKEVGDLLPEELSIRNEILNAAKAARDAEAQGRYQEQINDQYEEQLNLESKAQQWTKFSSTLMNSAFLLQSFGAIWETAFDEDLSVQEKATTILSNMAMTLPMVIMLMTELRDIKNSDTIATIANTLENAKSNAVKLSTATLMSAVTGLFGAEAAAKISDTLATRGLTIAQESLNIAMEMNPIGAVILLLTALITAIAAATTGVYGLVRSFQNENEKLAEQKTVLSDMKSNYDELVSSVNELSSAMEKIKDKKNNLAGLTKGTTEWKQAVIELNAEILKLLELYPELASSVTTGDNGVLQIDEKGLDEFYNKQLDSAKKLSDATLVQQNKVLEQSNKAAMETFAQDYQVGNIFGDTTKVEAAIEQGKEGINDLNLATKEAETAYYKLLEGVDKNTLAIDANNNLIGQSGSYTSYSAVDSNEFDKTARNKVIEKYSKQGLDAVWASGGPISALINSGSIFNKANGIQQDGASLEALAAALGVSSSNLTIKSSDSDNTTYKIDGQEEVTKSTEEIIQMLASMEATEMASTKRAEKDRALYEAMGATAVKVDGTIAKAGEAFDHFEDAGGHTIDDLTDLDLSSLTRTNKYGMTTAETTENLQLKLGIDEESAANLHDQIQAKLDSQGSFKLSYGFDDADKAIEEDKLFGKSSLEQFLQGGQTLEYLNALDEALGEDVDAFTLLTDKALNTRLAMVQLEQVTNAYNQTLQENQNDSKAVALNDIVNQIMALGKESDKSNEKLRTLLNSINEENPELLASLNIEYDQNQYVSVEDITSQIRNNLLELSEEDFTISIQAITNLKDTNEDIINSLENATSAAEKINNDFTVSYNDLEDVVAAFPGILGENGDAYATYADGTIKLNAEIAQAAIDAAQTDKDATVESQIEKIEAQKLAIDATIKGYQSEIDAAIEMNNAQGTSEAEKEKFIRESVERIAKYNDTLADASIEASKEMSIAAQQSEIEQREAKAETTDQAAKNDQIAAENFAGYLKNISNNVTTFIGNVIGPLGDAIISVFMGKPIGKVVQNVLFGGGFKTQSAERGSNSNQPSTEIGQYSSKFNGLEGYVEYLEQDKKILEETKNQLNGQEAQLRAIRGKSIQQSDIANKPDKDKKNSKDKKDAETKDRIRNEWDYLTDITNDLERQSYIVEKLSKLEDRLYGKDRISQIQKLQKEYRTNIKLLQQEQKLAEKHARKLRTKSEDENGNPTINAYAAQAGFKRISFDSKGNLEQGKAIENALTKRVNNAVDDYNKHRNDDNAAYYSKKVDTEKAIHDGFLKAMSEYQSTLGKIEDTDLEIQKNKEALQDEADKIVDAIQDGLDGVTKAIEDRRDFNKMVREWQEGGSNYTHFNSDRKYANEYLNGVFRYNSNLGNSPIKAQMNNVYDRIADARDVIGKNYKNADDAKLSQEQAYEDLSQATDGLKDTLSKMIENYESLLKTIEEASSKMDELINDRLGAFDEITDTLDSEMDQLKLVLGNRSLDRQEEIYSKKITVNMEKMNSIATAINQRQITVENLESLEASGKELSSQERQALKDARSEITSLQQEQIDTETQIFQDIAERLRTQTTKEMTNLTNSFFGQGADVDWMAQQWEVKTRNDNQYLDDYNRAYEIQKLQLKYQNLLNDSQNSSALIQKRIVDSMNEELTYLRDKQKLKINEKGIAESINAITEYDVKYAEAQLDILQKQIALEDARDAKSQMRLQRNAAGNYDFVYAADEDAVNKATEALLQAQQDAYNLSKQTYLETYQAAYEAAIKTRDMAVEIAMDTSISVEERAKRIQEIMNSLGEYIDNSRAELVVAGVDIYNSLVDAENMIAQENEGHLAVIFDEMALRSSGTAAAIKEASSSTKDAVSADWEEARNKGIESNDILQQSSTDTSDHIATKTQEISDSISEMLIGADGKIIDTTRTTDESITNSLTKIDKNAGIYSASIQGQVLSAIENIDGRFDLSKDNFIERTSNIQSNVKNAFDEITKALKQYQRDNTNALNAAGKDWSNFGKKSIDDADSKLKKLIANTNKWNTDLTSLNGVIQTSAGDVKNWKEEIDKAVDKSKLLIRESYNLQEKIKSLGLKAASSADKMGKLKDKTDNANIAATHATKAFAGMNSVISNGYSNIEDAADKAKEAAKNTTAAYKQMKKAANEAAEAIRNMPDPPTNNNSTKTTKNKTYSVSDEGFHNIWYIGDSYSGYGYATGGYTGSWSDHGVDDKSGKWAILHQKELVLNAHDTENMLSAVELVRDIMSGINNSIPSIGKSIAKQNINDTINQRVAINATFPGVTEVEDIKQALIGLADNAYQYANRYKY